MSPIHGVRGLIVSFAPQVHGRRKLSEQCKHRLFLPAREASTMLFYLVARLRIKDGHFLRSLVHRISARYATYMYAFCEIEPWLLCCCWRVQPVQWRFSWGQFPATISPVL